MSTHDLFKLLSEEYDQHNDRRERLIKASRDITSSSKKIIFLLHRLMNEDVPDDDSIKAHNAAGVAAAKLAEVQRMFSAMQADLEGHLFWRYQQQVSPGLQEYIEALSFAHFLEHGTLISHSEVQNTLLGSGGAQLFPLPISDYILGLSDLTGELMRYAITTLPHRGGQRRANEIVTFMRSCNADFERFTPYISDLRKKQVVSSQSLKKIEDATYAVTIRSSEYDLTPEALDDIVAQCFRSFSASGGADIKYDNYGESHDQVIS